MDNKHIRKATISGLGFRFAERILAQLVSTVVTIILARILLPEDYGVVAVVMVFITFGNVLVDSGLGSSLVQRKDADQTDFSTVFWSSIVIALFLYIILYLSAPSITLWYDNQQLTPILRVMGIRLPIAAVTSVQNAFINKNLLFKKFFLATLSGIILSGVLGIWAAVSGFGPWALVLQNISNVAIGTIFLWLTIKWRPGLLFSWNRFRILFSFGWKVLFSGVLTSVYEESRSLIIAGKYSLSDLSFYTKGQQFPKLLANNIGSTITNVMFPVFSVYQEDYSQLKKVLRRSVNTSSYVIFPLLVGFAAVAKLFVIIVLTEKWLPMVPYVYIFCGYYIFKPLKVINQSCLKAIGRSGLYLTLNMVEKTIGIASILISLRFGVFYLALSAVLTYAIAAVMEMIANGKLIGYNFKEQIGDIIGPIILSIIMGVPVFLLNFLTLNQYLVFILQIITGVAIYAGLSYVFHIEAFLYLLDMRKRKERY